MQRIQFGYYFHLVPNQVPLIMKVLWYETVNSSVQYIATYRTYCQTISPHNIGNVRRHYRNNPFNLRRPLYYRRGLSGINFATAFAWISWKYGSNLALIISLTVSYLLFSISTPMFWLLNLIKYEIPRYQHLDCKSYTNRFIVRSHRWGYHVFSCIHT